MFKKIFRALFSSIYIFSSSSFFLFLFSLFAFFSFYTNISQVNAAESIDAADFGIWHFDEMSGVMANDSGFNHHNLTWNSNVYGQGRPIPDRVPGKWDLGINFTQYEEQFSLENNPILDLNNGLSFGLWVKTDYDSSEKIRILWLGNFQDSRIQDPSNFIMLSVENGRAVLDLKQDKEWQNTLSSSLLVNNNQWHLLNAIFNIQTKRFHLYVDGQEQGSASFDAPLPQFQLMRVGRREYQYDSTQNNFSGVIDDLWLRTEAITAEKILDIYNSNSPYKQDISSSELAPVRVFASYDFDNVNGTVVLDNSGNHYDLLWGYNPYGLGEANPRFIEGKFNQGVNFKKVADTYALKFNTAQNFDQGISLGIWLKTETTSTDKTRILWFGDDVNQVMNNQALTNLFRLTEQNGKLTATLNYFDLYHQDLQKLFLRQYEAKSEKFISDNEWHLVNVSIDPRKNVHAMKLYIDGELQAETFFPNQIPGLKNLYLAHREMYATGTEYNFNGNLDDLFILNSVITDQDVKEIYNSNQNFTWPIQKKRNPVIIVPGIMGSYLNRVSDGEEIWPNLLKMVLPGKDTYLDELSLSNYGISPGLYIYPYDIVRNIKFLKIEKDFFQGLITELTITGYKENIDLFVFPYDWRLDISEIAGNDYSTATSTLSGFIKKVKHDSKSDKVDIVAHSMGGLVVKKYVHNSNNNSIDKFIDIATPHYGAPEAFKILQYGDDMGMSKNGFGLDAERVKTISQNFPSVYQLLPSKSYFESGNYFYDHYIYDVSLHKPALDYERSIECIKASGGNFILADRAQIIHDEIDNMVIPNTYNIVGCGVPTLGLFRIQDNTKDYEKDIDPKYLFGDGTVPLRSALGINASNIYYENKTEHAYLPSINGVRQLVGAILDNKLDSFAFDKYDNLSNNSNNCGYSGVQVGVH